MPQALVSQDSGLMEVIQALSPLDCISLDTEFHWERTYRPRLALVQVITAPGAGFAHVGVDSSSQGIYPVAENAPQHDYTVAFELISLVFVQLRHDICLLYWLAAFDDTKVPFGGVARK